MRASHESCDEVGKAEWDEYLPCGRQSMLSANDHAWVVFANVFARAMLTVSELASSPGLSTQIVTAKHTRDDKACLLS